jgi:hypothetical protein
MPKRNLQLTGMDWMKRHSSTRGYVMFAVSFGDSTKVTISSAKTIASR